MKNSLLHPPKTDFLKLLACAVMLIDHAGAIFGPVFFSYTAIFILRSIGRLAFPIFAYHIAVGVRNTGNEKKYLLRLFLFSLISQAPFYLSVHQGINVVATLLLGALSVYAFKRLSLTGKPAMLLFSFLIAIAAMYTAEKTGCDYGAFGVAVIFVFYVLKDRAAFCAVMQLILLAGYITMSYNPVKLFTIIPYILIFIQARRVKYPEIKLNKYFFYIFYPAHLLVLSGLLYFIRK